MSEIEFLYHLEAKKLKSGNSFCGHPVYEYSGHQCRCQSTSAGTATDCNVSHLCQNDILKTFTIAKCSTPIQCRQLLLKLFISYIIVIRLEQTAGTVQSLCGQLLQQEIWLPNLARPYQILLVAPKLSTIVGLNHHPPVTTNFLTQAEISLSA